VIRIAPDGSVPAGNPFAGRARRQTGDLELWPSQPTEPCDPTHNRRTLGKSSTAPRGGDEVNLIGKGKNYGLAGDRLTASITPVPRSTIRQPKTAWSSRSKYWVPSIAPVRHDLLYRKAVSEMERQPVHRRACAARLLVRPDAERQYRDGRRNACWKNFHGAYQGRPPGGRTGALWLLTDSSNGRVLRVGGRPAK